MNFCRIILTKFPLYPIMDTDPNLFIGLARSLKYTIELLLAEEVPENLSMTGLHSIILIFRVKYPFVLRPIADSKSK